MSNAPLIGITQRSIPASSVAEMPTPMASKVLTGQFTDYARRIQTAGGIPVNIAAGTDPAALVERLDGVIISGGRDVDPELYGSVPGPDSTPLDRPSDEFELALIREATMTGTPVLGICRGMQAINVAFGGTLGMAVELGDGGSHFRVDITPTHRAHAVMLSAGSTLHGIYGPHLEVNSLHRQAVAEPGDGVVVVGRSPDGVAEAVEVEGTTTLGVQWHPEMLDDHPPLFGWLVEAARTAAHEGEATPWNTDTTAGSRS